MRPLPFVVLFVTLGFSLPLAAGRARPVEPGPSPAFERLLLPITGDFVEGDAHWRTEFWLSNDGAEPMSALVTFPGCQVTCPGPGFSLQSHELEEIPFGVPNGIFVFIEKSNLANLNYSLRIENVAGLPDQDARALRGTELPLVRATSFQAAVHLMNIPSDEAVRKILRIYSLGIDDTDVDLQISAVDEFGGEVDLYHQSVNLSGGFQVYNLDSTPSFASVDLGMLLEPLQPQIPYRLITIWVRAVDPATRIWAFVALTSPTSTQMTTITPGR